VAAAAGTPKLRGAAAAAQVLIAVPVLFHIGRLAMGYSMADAIDSGWLLASEVRPPAPKPLARPSPPPPAERGCSALSAGVRDITPVLPIEATAAAAILICALPQHDHLLKTLRSTRKMVKYAMMY